ncbi:MAG: MarR family transcriptional regulator [Xanthomonadales bacterium]|nr:MarR family transcriptional regulator [Xanthomonadales bacterium]
MRIIRTMFDRCFYFNINALTRVVNKKWAKAFEVFDLSPAHGYMLRVVLSMPGISQKELGAELKLEKSTITRFVDALQKKGLVRRKRLTGIDGREQNIFPTKKAKKLHTSLEDLGETLYQEMVSSLGKEQLTMLVNQFRESAREIK